MSPAAQPDNAVSRNENRSILAQAIRPSSFFRDAFAISELEGLIGALAAAKAQTGALRAWVPGCGSGEEAYSIAILMQEARDKRPGLSVQVFATDLQASSLTRARSGKYPLELAADVQPRRIERFFERDGVGFRIGKRVRDCVVFSVHDLDSDPPFSRLDLIDCRNLRGLTAPEVQARLSALFHYGLSREGCLLVEPGEIWPSPELFTAENHTVFRRREAPGSVAVSWNQAALTGDGERAARAAERAARLSIERAVLEHYAPACIVFNQRCEILRLFGRTGTFLEAPAGEPTRDLTEMVRAELRVELRALIRRTLPGKNRTTQRVELRKAGSCQVFQLVLEPLPGTSVEDGLWALLIEEETTNVVALHSSRADNQIARLERELSLVRDELAHARREFAEANQRFLATNEELLTMNEELAATNEELESTKEMLESANLEFETLNLELELRLKELSRANCDLQNLLESTEIATLFLDQQLQVRTFTPAIRDLFSFIDSDRGRPLGDIAQRFEYESLEQDALEVLRSSTAKEAQIQLKGGRWFWMRILAYRSKENRVEGVLLTFAEITAVKKAEIEVERLRSELERQVRWLNALVQVVPVGLGYHRTGEAVLQLNRAGAELLTPEDVAVASSRTADSLSFAWSPGDDSSSTAAAAAAVLWDAMTAHQRVQGLEVELESRPGERKALVVYSTPLQHDNGDAYAQVSALMDVSDNKRAVRQAQERERQQALLAEIGLRALETGVFADFVAHSLQLIASALGVELAEVRQLQAESGELHPVAALGFGEGSQASKPETISHVELAGWFRARREPLDLPEPPPNRLSREDVLAGVEVAIWAGPDEAFGLLGVYSREARSFSVQERLFLRAVAQVFTTAIQRRIIDQTLARAREAPLESIVKQTQCCGQIVEAVLSFARHETTQRLPTAINDLLRRSAELVRSSFPPDRVEFVYELVDPSPIVDCNPTELEQVMVNLMKNAAQASNGTSRIDLRSHAFDGKVQVSIGDDGPGISADDRAQIFDPFFSTRRNAGGTGLGLSITHRILTSHGGNISLASGVTRGARFDIELPEWLPAAKG
jgi:chemotaxis methyl-accepting protein methylase/PAS domain-containing protein